MTKEIEVTIYINKSEIDSNGENKISIKGKRQNVILLLKLLFSQEGNDFSAILKIGTEFISERPLDKVQLSEIIDAYE